MAAHEPILVADIGGTNARFALVEKRDGVVSVLEKKATEADDYQNIGDAAHAFLASSGAKPARAVLAVAAPVTGDEIVFTNSPWRFSQRQLAQQLGLKSLQVVNDFAAMARGAVAATSAERALIKEGVSAAGAPTVVLGPGTGLGLGIVVEIGGRTSVLSTQGGFSAFSPQNEAEIGVLKFLQGEMAYVAFEHVLSGRGLTNLYRALGAATGAPSVSKPPGEITAAAIDRSDPVSVSATQMFCAILGTFAGDAALIAGARGGVILAGGILPKIEPILRASQFIERFATRDLMADYMGSIPVSLLLTGDAALIGAALLVSDSAPARH